MVLPNEFKILLITMAVEQAVPVSQTGLYRVLMLLAELCQVTGVKMWQKIGRKVVKT